MAMTQGACPPASGSTTVFDVRNAASCTEMLTQLFQAYMQAVTGQRRIIVRFHDRWSEYQKVNVSELLTVYQTLYTQCPAASTSGLPNLNPANKVRRGPPSRGFFAFPRM